MRHLTCLLIAFCIPATMICATDPPKLSPAEQEVVNVNKARIEAGNKRDEATWARYVADDCIFSDDDGVLLTKAQIIENVGKMPPEYDRTVNPRDYVVHIYGDTAVLNYRATGHEQFTDTDVISEARFTETYVKQNGSWLLVAKQWGLLPVNFRKPVAVDSSKYKDYVGHYESRPGDKGDTVFVKDGKLWSLTGKDPDECLPAGGDTFFFREGDLGTVTFTRDAQGHVTGYTYRLANGQEVHSKKTK